MFARNAIRACCLAAAPFVVSAACAGEPHVEVTHDAALDATRIHASMTMAAPPAAVYSIISECERAPAFVPKLASCRITRRDPGGRWDVRITEFHPIPFITIHARTRNSYEPDKRVTFHLLGGDMRVSEGEWRLTPRDNGRETLVEYDAAFALNFAAPRFLIDRTAAADFPTLLRNVERESLARTGQR